MIQDMKGTYANNEHLQQNNKLLVQDSICVHARNQALACTHATRRFFCEKKTQNYKQITKNSKRVESIVHDNLVKNGNKQSSRDKQELATWKCKYDELNAAVQKLSTETPV